jgi:hypothetical protein
MATRPASGMFPVIAAGLIGRIPVRSLVAGTSAL